MAKKERILRPVKQIRGGVRLPHFKNTAENETVSFSPDFVTIPLLQNIGTPCSPTVTKGDSVFVGTVIGESEAFVSSPIHSSVSGTVRETVKKQINGRPVDCIIIDSDGKFEPDPRLKPFEISSAEDLSKAARCCGLVGLGGAGFPTHIKLSPPKDSKIDTLIVNAAECEPYITSDYRECIEYTDDILSCIYLMLDKLCLEKVIICVESNKPRAIEKLYEMAADKRDFEDRVKLMRLPSCYPQGAEKVLIYSATGRKLPIGKLPSDIGCLVMNITSLGTLYRFIRSGMPLTEKRITIDGTAVERPVNISAPIGTPISELIKAVNVPEESIGSVIMGGPMMGNAVCDTDSAVEKRTNAVLIMKEEKADCSTPCIRCGKCAGVCPMRLFPARVEAAYRFSKAEEYEKLGVNYCMECGCCSYICPAKRPLTQIMRVAKAELRRNKE